MDNSEHTKQNTDELELEEEYDPFDGLDEDERRRLAHRMYMLRLERQAEALCQRRQPEKKKPEKEKKEQTKPTHRRLNLDPYQPCAPWLRGKGPSLPWLRKKRNKDKRK